MEFPAVAEILPHDGAMVLLQRVTSHAGDTTVCAAEIDDEALFRGPGGDVPAWIGLEYMAQCIAAHSGLIGLASGAAPRVGFLVGSRRMTLHVPAFRRGQRLAVQSRRIRGSSQGMAAFDCSIADADNGALLVEALLSCFLPGDDAAAGQA